MIYRAIKADRSAFLTGGTNNLTEAENQEDVLAEIGEREVPAMYMFQVHVGAETFFVAGEDLASLDKKAKRLLEMARRVDMEDAYMRVRTTDDGEFVEFVSPGLGYAVKAVSKYNREPVEFYIGAGTPWVRWVKTDDGGYSEVMFDQDAFDYEPRAEELKELGFDEPNVWYAATREKIKTSKSDKKKWVWKAA
jgi:hypothetical protein